MAETPTRHATMRDHAVVFRAHAWRWRRRIIRLGVAAVGGLTALLLLGLLLSRLAPSWWPNVASQDPAVRAVGEDLENAATRVLTQPRPATSGEWSVSLREADANAWLATRLRPWIESRDEEIRWPAEIGDVRIAITDDSVSVGARLTVTGQIITAHITPRIDERGVLWAPAHTIGAGRLRLPPSWLVTRGAPGDPNRAIASIPLGSVAVRTLLGELPVAAEPVIKLGDGRRVRLVKIACRDHRLDLTFRTEPPTTR